MADSQTITINLNTVAQSDGIKKTVDGLKSVREAVTSVAASLGGLPALITGAFTAITGGLIGKGISSAIHNASELGDSAERAGQKIEQFSALVGGKSGEKADAFGRAARFLTQWMEKTGQSGKDLTTVFLEQADVIASTSDQDEKLRIANERFGRSASELIPTLSKGSAFLREQMETSRLLGLVIGPEFAENAEKFEINLKRINSFLSGLFNTAAEELLPALLDGSNRIVTWMKESSSTIRDWIRGVIQSIIQAWREGRLAELISLSIQVGLEEGGRLGGDAFMSILSAAWNKLFSVDFLILAATAGRILANALLQAARIPIDFLNTAFQWLVDHVYNLWVEAFNKIGPLIGKITTSAFNAIVAGLNKIKVFGEFAPMKFVVDSEVLVNEGSFSEIFARNQKQSAEAVKNLTKYFDDQIRATKELLTTGEMSLSQDSAQITAYSKLLALLRDLKAASADLAKTNEVSRGELFGPPQPTKGGIENDQKQIDIEIEKNNLLIEELRTRGLITGSIRDESIEIGGVLEKIRELAEQKQQLTEEEKNFGLISAPEARKQEIKDAEELLKIINEIVNHKQSGTEPGLSGFFNRLNVDLDKLIDKTRSVSAKIADTLSNGISSAIDGVSNGIWQVIDGTATWADIFRQVGREIISGLIKIAIQEIFLDNLKRGITLAWKAFRSAIGWGEVAEHGAQKTTEVAQHTAAEGTKTGSTLFGSIARGAIRLGETVFHGLQVGLRVAAHIAGEIAMTAATVLQSAIRIGKIVAESIVYLVKAAFEGASAVADIPYVGPILAIAAIAAIIAAGLATMGKFEKGGVVRGGRQVIQVNENGTESVLNARATAMLGEGLINDLNAGIATRNDLNQSKMMAVPVGSGNQPMQVSFVLVDSRNSQAARDHIASSAGRAQIVEIVRDQRTEIGIKS